MAPVGIALIEAHLLLVVASLFFLSFLILIYWFFLVYPLLRGKSLTKVIILSQKKEEIKNKFNAKKEHYSAVKS